MKEDEVEREWLRCYDAVACLPPHYLLIDVMGVSDWSIPGTSRELTYNIIGTVLKDQQRLYLTYISTVVVKHNGTDRSVVRFGNSTPGKSLKGSLEVLTLTHEDRFFDISRKVK